MSTWRAIFASVFAAETGWIFGIATTNDVPALLLAMIPALTMCIVYTVATVAALRRLP